MPSPTLLPVMAHVSPEERRAIRNRAKSCNMSVSAYARRLLAGQPLPNVEKHRDIKELAKIAANLARLGNLFKLALDEEDFAELQAAKGKDAFAVMQQIQETNTLLKSTILELKKT